MTSRKVRAVAGSGDLPRLSSESGLLFDTGIPMDTPRLTRGAPRGLPLRYNYDVLVARRACVQRCICVCSLHGCLQHPGFNGVGARSGMLISVFPVLLPFLKLMRFPANPWLPLGGHS